MAAYASNRAVMDEGLTIFLGAITPYLIREIEMLADKPVDVAASEMFGQEVGARFVEDLSNYESGVSGRGRALTRITLTVELSRAGQRWTTAAERSCVCLKSRPDCQGVECRQIWD